MLTEETGKRIANALERLVDIAEAREERDRLLDDRGKRRPIDIQVDHYLKLLRQHADELEGRMGLPEIAFVIGASITRREYKAIGIALTKYGAIKSTSGARRYYYFDK